MLCHVLQVFLVNPDTDEAMRSDGELPSKHQNQEKFHFLRSISHDLNQHLELIFLYYYLFLVDVYNPYVTSFI